MACRGAQLGGMEQPALVELDEARRAEHHGEAAIFASFVVMKFRIFFLFLRSNDSSACKEMAFLCLVSNVGGNLCEHKECWWEALIITHSTMNSLLFCRYKLLRSIMHLAGPHRCLINSW